MDASPGAPLAPPPIELSPAWTVVAVVAILLLIPGIRLGWWLAHRLQDWWSHGDWRYRH